MEFCVECYSTGRLDGKSYRAEKQVHDLNRRHGGNFFKSKIVNRNIPGNAKARDIELGRVNAYSEAAQRVGATRGGILAPRGTPKSPVGNLRPTAKI
jgi:hypothetical protein